MSIAALLPILGTVLERILPDQKASDDAKLRVMELMQRGELAQLDADVKLATGQLEVNKAEASSGDPFTTRWRPFIGWVCGFGCAWNWIGLPVAKFAMEAIGHPVALAPADLSEMMPLLLGMLGLGGYRTLEKIKKVA